VLAHSLVVSDLILVTLSISIEGYCKCIMLVQGTEPDEAKVAKVERFERLLDRRIPHKAQEPTYPKYRRLSRIPSLLGPLVVDGSAAVVNWPVCTRWFLSFSGFAFIPFNLASFPTGEPTPTHLHLSQPDHPKTCMHRMYLLLLYHILEI
jgi:hypothetical protein